MTIQTATLGYPRIGKNREVKTALEAFWSGKSDAESLLQKVREVEFANWKIQLEAGIDRIGIADTTLYDHVLNWSVRSHMCDSEFGDIIQHIERLDADVLSIENSRSNNRTLQEVTEAGYSHQIGNGVYDIHSPVVPTTEQLVQQLEAGIKNLPVRQIWVNPDCGLKTRRWEEVIPALKNMVQATKAIRENANAQ
ncbi:hypothetical protein ACN4EG_25130 [Alkalinema pantanalense CENA528]|uniref:hypothetical protein n=1 Tax=Alkalinema pantanalense TaxID=1620705 RepID=UPI003D6EFEEA